MITSMGGEALKERVVPGRDNTTSRPDSINRSERSKGRRKKSGGFGGRERSELALLNRKDVRESGGDVSLHDAALNRIPKTTSVPGFK